MRVGVTGGTGFVGPAVVQAMLDDGHEVVALEHRTPLPLEHPRLVRAKGNVLDPASLREAFAGCEAVAHLVAIRRGSEADFERMHVEATRNVVEAAKAVGARRLLLMSAHGVEAADTPYFRTKLEMERLARESGLAWTVFRPTFVSGDEDGGFDREFAGIVDKAPVLPSFDGGRFELQPVARRDVGQAFSHALSRPDTAGRTYDLAGPERMTWNDYMRRLAELRGRRRALAPVPRWVILPAVSLLGPLAPASRDEMKMLMRDHVADTRPSEEDLGLHLTPWRDAVAGLARHGQG